jgi:hypothetical protein
MLSSLIIAIAIGSAARDASPHPAATRRFEANVGQWPSTVRFLARTPHSSLMLGATDAKLHLRAADGRRARIDLRWDSAAGAIIGIERLPGVSNYLIGGDRDHWRRGVAAFRRVRYADIAPLVDIEFYGAVQGFEYDVVVRPGGDLAALTLRLDGVSKRWLDHDGALILETNAGTLRQRRPIAFQEHGGIRSPVQVRYDLRGDRLGFVVGNYDHTQTLVIDPTIDFSTYLGSFGNEEGQSVASDVAGNIYVTGYTTVNFSPGDGDWRLAGEYDVFVSKFSPNGSTLLYSTYLGGSDNERPYGLAVATDGTVYVGGWTRSTNFPAVSAFQSSNGELAGFLARVTADGTGLIFSTYLGGTADDKIEGVAVDASGAAYVTGTTRSSDFPLINATRTVPGGSFIAKFTATGTPLFSTYFGDMGQAGTLSAEFRVSLHAITVDKAGAVYIAGDALSSTLPATPGAYQTAPGNSTACLDPTFRDNPYPCLDGVVAKLSPDGTLIYATYLHAAIEAGTKPIESVSGITVDAQGNAYVLGTTSSLKFPITPGATGRTCTDPCPQSVFVTKLNQAGNTVLFSSVLGSATADSLTGDTVFIFTAQRGFPSQAIALDAAGNVVVAGMTKAPDFPTLNPQQAQHGGTKDAFVAALSASGALVYSSYLGGSDEETAFGLAATRDSAVLVVGGTWSVNFPTSNAFQLDRPLDDVFITKLRFPQIISKIDAPFDQGTVFMPFKLSGWALDRGAAASVGIDGVHVWAYPVSGPPIFIGAIRPSSPRSDIGLQYGPQFANPGFDLTIEGLVPGLYTFAIYPHSSVTNTFAPPQLVALQVEQGGLIAIGVPTHGATAYGGTTLGGWAIDRASTTDTGVSTVHVYAYPNPGSGAAPNFLGVAGYGVARPDVGAIFGSEFTNSGFNLRLPPLAPGPYLLVAFPFSTMKNAFLAPATVTVTIGPSRPNGALNPPANNATVSGNFLVGGWALDLSAPEGVGVDAVHVYAFPTNGAAARFMGVAQYGISRPDVGAIFGSQFAASGYSLTAPLLPAGTYDIYAFSRSTVSGTFNFAAVARVTVQ